MCFKSRYVSTFSSHPPLPSLRLLPLLWLNEHLNLKIRSSNQILSVQSFLSSKHLFLLCFLFITGQTQISFWSPSFHSFFFPNIIFSYSILMKRYYCMFSISFLHRVGDKDLPTTWAWYLHMRQTSEFLFLISYLICIKNRLVVESLISITVSTSFLISTYS